ncbi:hypothetical protein ACFUN8_08605 [Streptomyces sp. NPDC057307]|uniref:hypothetical protein n=1 Tax=Streptomyces sp. NPDC057307 TaxID=3346096 RepID=UPI00364389FC
MERPNNRKRVVATAVAGGLVAVTLAGCGSGGSDGGKKSAGGGGPDGVKQSTRAVQATHHKTAGAKTAKLTLATEVKGAGEQAAATGAGVVDLADGSSDVTLTSQGQELQQRTLDGMIYQQPPAGSGSGLPDGKSWMKIDLAKLAEQQGAGAGAGQVSDPAASFSYTKGISDKNVKKVGTATVDGAKTTHYRVTVDVDALAKDNTEQTRKLKEQLGATLPLDIWLDGDGRLRQQKMELTVKRPAGETEGPAQVAVLTTLKLSDFGTDVNVTAPAAKDTVDVTAKLAEQGSGNQAG